MDRTAHRLVPVGNNVFRIEHPVIEDLLRKGYALSADGNELAEDYIDAAHDMLADCAEKNGMPYIMLFTRPGRKNPDNFYVALRK